MELIPGKLYFVLILASLLSLSYGKSLNRNKLVSRIVNGKDAADGQFPYYVDLLSYHPADGESSYYVVACGAALITQRHCLTAAHCTQGATTIQAVMGFDNENDTSTETLYYADEYWIHPEFNIETLDNDVSVVRLFFEVERTNSVRPITISCNVADTPSNSPVVVAGHGLTSDSAQDLPSQLQYANLITISTDECEDYYSFITDEIICTKSADGAATCSGDSGSAMAQMMKNDAGEEFPVHCGIVSFGSPEGCGSGIPDGYSRTASYASWIISVVTIAAADGVEYNVTCTK